MALITCYCHAVSIRDVLSVAVLRSTMVSRTDHRSGTGRQWTPQAMRINTTVSLLSQEMPLKTEQRHGKVRPNGCGMVAVVFGCGPRWGMRPTFQLRVCRRRVRKSPADGTGPYNVSWHAFGWIFVRVLLLTKGWNFFQSSIQRVE